MKLFNRLPALIGVIAVALPALPTPRAQKLDPEEVVQSHLASIGAEEVRKNVRTRVVRGVGRISILLGGNAQLGGTAFLVSKGPMLRYVVDIGNPSYQREDFSFNGDKQAVGYVSPGRYSTLGEFLNLYDDILKEGLLGGVLSTAWPLLDMDQRKPRLKYSGLKKIDDEQMHVLDYTMRKGGRDLRIKLYFEPETFRHRGTDYDVRTPAAQMGPTPGTSSRIRQAEFGLTERFDDFQEIESNTLPTKWTLQLSIDQGVGGSRSLWQWEMTYDEITHNQAVGAEIFEVFPKAEGQ